MLTKYGFRAALALSAFTLVLAIAGLKGYAKADGVDTKIVACALIVAESEYVTLEQAGSFCTNLNKWAQEAINAGRSDAVDMYMFGLVREKKSGKLSRQ